MIELSFVIPAYNVEKYIERCLNSIFSQNVDESLYEVIVIDDGSTDNTLELLNREAKKHGNLHVITQENQGPSVARNNGIELSKGKYIWFVDSDDYIVEGATTHFLNITTTSDFDLFFFNVIVTELDGTQHRDVIPSNLTNRVVVGKDAVKRGFDKGSVCLAGWKRSFVNARNLRFLPDVKWGEDSLFVYSAVIQASKMTVVDIPLYAYERRPGSLTTSDSLEKYRSHALGDIQIIKSLVDLSEKYKGVDAEISHLAEIQSKRLLFGLLASLYKGKRIYNESGTNGVIVSMLKSEGLYPIKRPYGSAKKFILSLLLNREFLIC